MICYIRISFRAMPCLPRPSASQWHDATLGAVALMARSGVSVLLKRRTALQLDTLTGLLSQQSEQPTTAEMNAKLAVCTYKLTISETFHINHMIRTFVFFFLDHSLIVSRTAKQNPR